MGDWHPYGNPNAKGEPGAKSGARAEAIKSHDELSETKKRGILFLLRGGRSIGSIVDQLRVDRHVVAGIAADMDAHDAKGPKGFF